MANFYVSSYGKDHKKGIYICNIDDQDGSLQCLKHIPTTDYPSYIIQKDHLLYVSYKNATNKPVNGGLGSYTIIENDLILNNNYASSGRSYTHLCVDDERRYLFAANYHFGATASYRLDEDGRIDCKIGAIHHVGLGPDLLKRQTGPHAHQVGFTPDRKFLYSVDLGADKIVMYRVIDGKLEEAPEYHVNILPGSGPRHMIFSKDGRFAYLVNEIANTLMVFKYHEGQFHLLQMLSTIPRHFKGFSSASAIRMSASGRYLFISNRGHDSIAFYRVHQETGKVMLLYMVHTGKEPRDFNLYQDRYLIVGCQQDHCLNVLRFHESIEVLEKTEQTLEIPSPVCILTMENPISK